MKTYPPLFRLYGLLNLFLVTAILQSEKNDENLEIWEEYHCCCCGHFAELLAMSWCAQQDEAFIPSRSPVAVSRLA